MPASGQPNVARFEYLQALGAGGGGEVWLARDRKRDALVAIKVLRPELASDRAALDAFQRLLARIAALGDPNILRIHEVDSCDREARLIMEYAPGGDATALRGRPSEQVLRAVLPIARALESLHAAGIVHRDVKASNVLLMADGSPRLGDFEAAVSMSDEVSRSLAPGSRYSMSPESLDAAPATSAVDVYGFGAMLYELLSGYPPFYPNVTPERIRSEVPARISASAPIPESLQALVAWCLRKAPAERPSSMAIVATHLQSAWAELQTSVHGNSGGDLRGPSRLGQMSNESNSQAPVEASGRAETPVIRPPAPPAEPLRGEWRRTTQAAPDPSEFRKQGFRRGLTVGGVVLAALAVFIVFFALPKWVDTPTPAQYRPAASTAKVEKPGEAARKEPVDFAELARAKQDVDDAREPLFERLEKLRERAVEQWAADDFKKATAELAAADAQYEQREYVVALQHLQTLDPMIAVLEARAGVVLKEQLAAGAQAIADGRSADAKSAFELAVKLEPKNATATRGLQRAGTLDQVLALLASAQRAEQDGNTTAALADFRKALELDKDMMQANEGIARVTARVAGDAFASAMARGFAALGADDYRGARDAFEAAGKIRPNSSEVADALKQVEQSGRTRSIAGKLDAAREAESREQWADALSSYKEILSLDTTVAAAKEGVARVQPRAELNAQLEIYLTQPERLFSSPVRAAARQTLERAGAIANPGPVLTQQKAKLNDWLAKADVPVQVALQSDNLTQVTVFRIGALGAFEQRSLELEPGEYTVLGTRPGYRDVRRQIMVVPGTPMEPIVIRCEDKI